MEPIDYLKRIRERWRFITVITVLAIIAGSAAGFLVSQTKSATGYKATTILIQEGSTQGGSREQVQRQNTETAAKTGTNLRIASAYLVTGEIASKVASGLNLPTGQKPPGKLAWLYSGEQNNLAISVTTFDAEMGRKTADLYAEALIAYVKDLDKKKNDAEALSLQNQIKQLEAEVAALDKKIAKYPGTQPSTSSTSNRGSGQGAGTPTNTGSPADPLITQRGAALVQLSVVSAALHTIQARVPDSAGIVVLDPAKVSKLSPTQARALLQFPTGAVVAGILGLLFAAGLTLMRERLNGHLRSKNAIERSFGVPVLAEIPLVRPADGNGSLPSQNDVRAADAFRLLGAALGAQPGGGRGPNGRMRPSQTIVVTSSGPDEGTSTVVAELASTFAQSGLQTLILSCDFRNPGVHRFFGVSNDTGLAEALLWTNGDSVLEGCVRSTTVLGVSVVPSGSAVARPSELLALGNLRRAIREAHGRADVVLIDTPPILTSDITFLLSEAQTVLVVARAGTTSQKVAARSADLLRQLGAPVAGVALIGAGTGGLPKDYYEPIGWLERTRRVVRAVSLPARLAGRGVAWVARPIVPMLRLVGRPAASIVSTPVRFVRRPFTRRKAAPIVAKPSEIRLDPPVSVPVKSSNGGNGAPVQPQGSSIDLRDDAAAEPSAASTLGRRGFPRLSRRSPD